MQSTSQFWRYKLRPFTWDDLYTVQALLNVISQYEQDPHFYTIEWLYYVLEKPNVNAKRNCFVAILETDRIIGYSRVESKDDLSQWKVSAGVHPEFTGIGIGQGLIRVNDFNLMAIHPSNQPLIVIRQSFTHNKKSIKLLTRMGYKQLSIGEENHVLWEKTLR